MHLSSSAANYQTVQPRPTGKPNWLCSIQHNPAGYLVLLVCLDDDRGGRLCGRVSLPAVWKFWAEFRIGATSPFCRWHWGQLLTKALLILSEKLCFLVVIAARDPSEWSVRGLGSEIHVRGPRWLWQRLLCRVPLPCAQGGQVATQVKPRTDSCNSPSRMWSFHVFPWFFSPPPPLLFDVNCEFETVTV